MSDKISALPAVALASLVNTDVVPIVNGGATKKVPLADLRGSASGSVSVANNTFVTLFNAAPAGIYLLTTYLVGGGASYQTFSVVLSDGTTPVVRQTITGAGFITEVQVSGSNVQARQTSGVTNPIAWSYIRVG